MKFIEAMKAIQEGKEILVNGQKTFTGTCGEFFYSNFEVVEEKKTLSDKVYVEEQHKKMANGTRVYFEEDVKQFITAIIRKLEGNGKKVDGAIRYYIEELAGTKL